MQEQATFRSAGSSRSVGRGCRVTINLRRGIELVGLAFAIQGDGRDEKTLGTGGHELAVEHKTEAATFLHAADLATFGDPLFDLGEELFAGEFAGRVGI